MSVTKLLTSDDDSYQDRGAQVTLAFGSSNTDSTSTTVTGLPWVSSDSRFALSIVGSSSRSIEEALIEQLAVGIGDVVAGVGFTVYAHAPNGTSGDFTVHVVGV